MSATYMPGFRESLVRRLTGPAAMTASALAKETGVAQSTLSRWLLAAPTLPAMNARRDDDPEPKSTRQRTPEEQLALVAEAAKVPAAELGAFLRRHGLRTADVAAWRQQLLAGLSDRKADRRRAAAEAGRVKNLERELERSARKLRAAEALLDLQKKVRAIWGDEGEFTPPKSAP